MVQKKTKPPLCGSASRPAGGLARLLRRLKEHELLQRWNGSKVKKDETVGKKAELELRRRIGDGREYHQVKKSRQEERERSRLAERFRRFILRMVPLAEKPMEGQRGGGT